jgi:long-chain acyl-CoA synthetase
MNGVLILGEMILLTEDITLDRISEIISRGEVTVLVDTPERFDSLYTKIDFEKTNLRIGVTVEQSLRDNIIEKWEKNRNFQFIETYGITEASPVVSVNLGSHFENCSSIGLPISCNQLNVVDENGADTRIGELGELQVKGKNVAKYYIGREAGFYLGEQRWLSTGDIVRCSSNGDYCFECRKSDLIDKYGYKISPKSIEEVISKHYKVKEVVIVGIPGSSVGKHIKACIIPKENEKLNRSEVFDYAEENLPKYLNPDIVVFYEEFPRDKMGRIDRKVLTKD